MKGGDLYSALTTCGTLERFNPARITGRDKVETTKQMFSGLPLCRN